MHISLVIAILALVAWALLPQLDRYIGAETETQGPRSYLVRLAHWINS